MLYSSNTYTEHTGKSGIGYYQQIKDRLENFICTYTEHTGKSGIGNLMQFNRCIK